MIDLNLKVFGNLTAQEVIGAIPPRTPEWEQNLEQLLLQMTENLDDKNNVELQEILKQMLYAKNELDRLTGAKAMDQKKIEFVMEIISKYVTAVNKKLRL